MYEYEYDEDDGDTKPYAALLHALWPVQLH